MTELVEKKVFDYDLFELATSLSTTTAPLTYYGMTIPGTTTPWTVPTPGSYVQKINRLVITNTGTGTATVTVSAASVNTSSPTLTLLQVSLAAGDTKTFTKDEITFELPETYYLQAVISAGSGYIQAKAYFVPG